jgi:hypothetical protein
MIGFSNPGLAHWMSVMAEHMNQQQQHSQEQSHHSHHSSSSGYGMWPAAAANGVEVEIEWGID